MKSLIFISTIAFLVILIYGLTYWVDLLKPTAAYVLLIILLIGGLIVRERI